MNDFTKEELSIIYLVFKDSKLEMDFPNECQEVMDKVKTLIDVYCEHRWFSGGNRLWLHCIKCKSNFHHE